MRRRRTGKRHSRRGAAVAEFALVAPLLALVTFGSIDVGNLVHVSQLVSNASREGARTASRVDIVSDDDVEDTAEDYLEGVGIDSDAVTVTVRDGNGNVVSDLTMIASGDPVSVQVVLDYDSARWISFLDFLNALQPSSTTIMRRD